MRPLGEVLADNSLAYIQSAVDRPNPGSVEIFLASKGTTPISGLPGKPTTQGKNERSQTLMRFLGADRPTTLEQLRGRVQCGGPRLEQRKARLQRNHQSAELESNSTSRSVSLSRAVMTNFAAQSRQ